jgi:hypothetical protein
MRTNPTPGRIFRAHYRSGDVHLVYESVGNSRPQLRALPISVSRPTALIDLPTVTPAESDDDLQWDPDVFSDMDNEMDVMSTNDARNNTHATEDVPQCEGSVPSPGTTFDVHK